MQRDHVPHALGTRRLHAGLEQRRSHHIGATHLEALGPIEPRRQPDIVQDRADVEHFHVDLDRVGSGHQRGELEAALAVRDHVCGAACQHEVMGPAGEFGSGRGDRWLAHDGSVGPAAWRAAITSISISQRSSQ